MIKGICPVHPDYYEPCVPCALGLAKHTMELPKFETATYVSNALDTGLLMGQARPAVGLVGATDSALDKFIAGEAWRRFQEDAAVKTTGQVNQQTNHQPKEKYVSRIVRVIIADTNENLPLDKRILHMSEEFHTDLTDQELFFEANPSQLLAKHNEYRTTVLDKRLTESSGKEHRLEPARIRDIKMVVVVITNL